MENDSIKGKLLNYGVKAVIGAGVSYGLYKAYNYYMKSLLEGQTGKKIEIGQAMIIHSAMNPSGIELLDKTDGTNTEVIFDVANKITDLKLVTDAYSTLFHTDMLDDLQKELSPEDYTKFLNTLKFSPVNKAKGTADKPKNDFKKGTILITKLPTNLRRTPENIGQYSLSSNIIKLAEKGKILGFATGKTQFDNAGAGTTGTLFIEIQASSFDTHKIINFWAASSQLEAISNADYLARKYPFFFVNEKDVLGGVDGHHQTVIVTKSTPVLNEQFKAIGIASPFQVLGYSIMELNDRKGNEYIKFITKDRRQHWINKKFVQAQA